MTYKIGDYIYWKPYKKIAKVVDITTDVQGTTKIWCYWWADYRRGGPTYHRSTDSDFRLATTAELVLYGDKTNDE